MAKDIYEGILTEGDIDPRMTTLVAQYLQQSVTEGYGKDFAAVQYGTPDYDMLANLEKNVYAFSAAKNYQELKSMTIALKDENGNVRKFSEFRKEATKIDKQYNVTWLQTEYNTAIGSGQMAGRWVEFERNKDIMPMLRYETAGDARVRPDHARLDGVTKNMDDAFWNSYYPPNGWGCRCDVVQLPSGAETPTDRIQYPDVPPMFRVNLAKEGLAFPPGHSYYKGIPQATIGAGLKLYQKEKIPVVQKEILAWAKRSLFHPVETGNTKAFRFEGKITNVDKTIVINKRSLHENFTHYKNDPGYIGRISLLYASEELLKSAKFDGYEKPRHVNARQFWRFNSVYKGRNVIMMFREVTEDLENIYLYYLNYGK